jgi:hypothetical protein
MKDEFPKNILKFHERLKEDLGNFGIYKHKLLKILSNFQKDIIEYDP